MKNHSRHIIVYCSNIPHGTPPSDRFRFACALAATQPVIFIDIPTYQNRINITAILSLYVRLCIYFVRQKGVFVWQPSFFGSPVHFVIFRIFLRLFKIIHKRNIVLYTTSSDDDPVYSYVPADFTLFDCYDNPNNELSRNQTTISRFNAVCANTPLIFAMLKKINTNCHLISAGYDNYRLHSKESAHMQNTVVFYGGISHRINYDWLYEAVTRLPTIHFFFLGETYLHTYYRDPADFNCEKMWNKILRQKNVHYWNAVNAASAPSMLSSFSVGIIPYTLTDSFTYYSHPMKLYDYLAGLIPVISAPIPSMLRYKSLVSIYFASNTDEFVALIRKHAAQNIKVNASELRAIRIILAKQSVNTKLRQIIQIIQKHTTI
jgi:hypothetical protein